MLDDYADQSCTLLMVLQASLSRDRVGISFLGEQCNPSGFRTLQPRPRLKFIHSLPFKLITKKHRT